MWLLLCGGLFFSQAAPVDVETARQVAKNFYFERVNIEGQMTYSDIVFSDEIPVMSNATVLYYVFNVSGDLGWVAVSGDDRTVPVLSYAFKGSYGTQSQPDNFAYWMNRYSNQIQRIIEEDQAGTQESADLWKLYSAEDFSSPKSTLAVAPLLGSIAWGQGCYYNAQCPVAVGGDCGHVPTGCVATAMAMIMKKHAYPTHGFSSHSYSHPTYGTLSANFGTATYGWSSMPNTCNSSNTEVAEIMKHCGVSVEMDYDVYGSGAYLYDAVTAFKTYFIYAATYANKQTYTDADWKALLKADLDLGHPILYAGQDISGGHAFVCDGYQGSNNDYFHFNWGWEGAYNSYNYVTSLIPGGNSSNGDYTDNQEAVVNIYPDPAVIPAANFTANNTVIAVNNFVNFTDQSTNDPLIWAWSVNPTTGTSFVGGTTSASKNAKIGFTATGQFTISLTVTNAAGSDTETKNNYITVTGGAGVDENTASSISIYPNPVSDEVYVETPKGFPSDLQLHLYNLLGDQIDVNVVEVDGMRMVLPVSTLPQGLYYLSLQGSDLNLTVKIAVRH
jgi:PKD repeat protein